MPDPRRRYRWDPATAQYRAPNGRFVSRGAVRGALDRAITSEAKHMLDMLQQLRLGQLSLDGWYAGMRQSIKLVHLWAAAAASGGWAQLDASDYGRVGQIIRFHYDRLARFAEQLANRLPIDGRAVIRVGMYAKAARKTYHDIELVLTQEAGFTEERNILDPAAESCAECLDLASLGWVPIGTMPRPGNRLCLTNCACTLEYRLNSP